MMPKQSSNSDFDLFNSAMDTILKADPAKVKAEMEAEKREREEQRKAKSTSATSPTSLRTTTDRPRGQH
jgi:hypothetical protein